MQSFLSTAASISSRVEGNIRIALRWGALRYGDGAVFLPNNRFRQKIRFNISILVVESKYEKIDGHHGV